MSGENSSMMEIVEVYVTPGSEILILPKTYISRSMSQLAPLQHLQGLRRATLSTTFGLHNGDVSIFPSPPPFIRTFKETEIVNFPQKNRLRFLYALPGHGTTTIMINQIVRLQQHERTKDRWISYMDLRRVIPVLSKQNFDKTWTLSKMIIAYNNVTKPEVIDNIESFFNPVPIRTKENGKQEHYKMEVNNHENDDAGAILAELFLDEIDEIPPEAQDIVLDILKNVDWNRSATRVWVASRPHLKPRFDNTIKEDGSIIASFELMPLTREEQILLWVDSWKLNFPSMLLEHRLKRFSADLHTHMEHHFPNFSGTIGACPTHLQLLAEYFADTVKEYVNDPSNANGTKSPLFNISSVKILQFLVKGKFETYMSQWICEQPLSSMLKNEVELERLKEREFRRLQKLQVRFAISTYANNYTTNRQFIFYTVNTQPKLEFDVYRLGIIYEMNGGVEFLHPKYAEFILAQFFVDSGKRQIGLYHMSFFLNKIMFEDNCKPIRKYFNDYLTLRRERKKAKQYTGWEVLSDFLSQHYCLKGDGQMNPSHAASYEDIKTFGSVVHLCIMEGNLSIYELIINSFPPNSYELRRLLSITAPLVIFNDNPFSSRMQCTPETHAVSAFHLLALFGRGDEAMMKRLVGHHFRIFAWTSRLQRYFEDGTWTPLHYAGMSSNHEFLHGLFCPRTSGFKVSNVNLANPKGQHPSHMVLARGCWYYGLKISDPPHHTMPKSNPSSSSSSSKTLSLKKAKKTSKPVKSQPLQNKIKSPVDVELLKKSCKEIWTFEGTSKDFNESWDHHFYPNKGGFLRPHLSVLKLLFENGGIVNSQQDGNGKALLHLAASYSSPTLTKFLLDNGADPKRVDFSGKIPSYYAEINGNANVMLQLLVSETQQILNVIHPTIMVNGKVESE